MQRANGCPLIHTTIHKQEIHMPHLQEFFGNRQVNLGAAVGARGVNSKDDVIAVQALLKYAMSDRKAWSGVKFPEPTGVMDAATVSLIRKYQSFARRRSNGAVSVDGRIDPAKGERAYGKRGLWTILMLNGDAMETWVMKGAQNSSFIRDMGLQYPAFQAAIGEGVGTLNLPLEGSGVGSLGLTLE
jgi:hypothetical protein